MKAKLKFSAVLAGIFLASGVFSSEAKAEKVVQNTSYESVNWNDEVTSLEKDDNINVSEEVSLENEKSILNEDPFYLNSTNFPDSELRSLLASALKVNEGDDIRFYLTDINGLWMTGSISNLKGLEHFTNLTYLKINGGSKLDISALSNLTSLVTLDLYNCGITDISALSNLTNLEELNLGYNNNLLNSQRSVLGNLTKLKYLSLYNTGIGIIDFASNLTELEVLDLSTRSSSSGANVNDDLKYKVEDLTPLQNLTNLRELYLASNAISDVTVLGSLTNLEILTLHNQSGQGSNNGNGTLLDVDLSPLSNLTKLVELNISANETLTSDQLSFLKSLTNLKILDLYNDSITDISFLEGLTSLEYLMLDTNSISDLSPLKGLTNLKFLSLANNSSIEASTYTNLPITTEGYVLVTDVGVDLTQYTTEHTFYEVSNTGSYGNYYTFESTEEEKTDWTTTQRYLTSSTRAGVVSYVEGSEEESSVEEDKEEDVVDSSQNESTTDEETSEEAIISNTTGGDGVVIFPIESTTEESLEFNNTEYFEDLENHWAKVYIYDLYEKGIVSGYPDGTFRPDLSTTRGDIAVLMCNVLNYLNVDTSDLEIEEVNFTDVATNKYYYDEVQSANFLDIMVGYGDNTFKPGNTITREEFVMVLYKLISKGYVTLDETNSKEFTDYDEISWWCKDAFDYVNKTGLITGYTDGSFNPQGNLTRAEVITFLYKILN